MTCKIPELENLLSEVHKAGQLLLEKWPGGKGSQKNLNIENKSDGSAVTEADYASNTILVNAISRLYPNDGIISEELPISEPRVNTVWIIDPLDGTQSFIDGMDDFSILVAKVENYKPVSAIMYFPALDITAVAKKGQGAFINNAPVKVAQNTVPREKSVYVRNFESSPLEWMYPKRMDSGRALLAVANGEFDGTLIKMGRHKEWDLAATSLVITEAGGYVRDELNQEILFNQPQINYKYFIAGGSREVQDFLIDFSQTLKN